MSRKSLQGFIVWAIVSSQLICSFGIGGGATTYSVTYDALIKNGALGNYKVKMESYEIPRYEWLPIISKDYFQRTEENYQSEIDNIAPSAVYKARAVNKVDIVFAVGKTDRTNQIATYTSVFEQLLNAPGNNIDAYVEKIETSTLEMTGEGAREIFNTWENVPAGNPNWRFTEDYIWTPVNQATTMGFVNPDAYNTTDVILECDIWTGDLNGWHGNSYGLWFRYSENDNGGYDCYVLFLSTPYGHGGWRYCSNHQWDGDPEYSILVCKMTDVQMNFRMPYWVSTMSLCLYWDMEEQYAENTHRLVYGHGLPMRLEPGVTYVNSYSNDNSSCTVLGGYTGSIANDGSEIDLRDFRVEVQGANIRVYHGGELRIDVTDPDPILKGSYGMWSLSAPNVYFADFKATASTAKTLSDVASDANWREGSQKFIIYVEEELPKYLQDTENEQYQYTVAKLINTNAHLINLGNDLNKTVLEGLLKAFSPSSETRGAFYDNAELETAINLAKDYILEKASSKDTNVQYILVDTEMDWETEYKDNEKDLPLNFGLHDGTNGNDTADIILSNLWGVGLTRLFDEDKLQAEKWRFKHNSVYFDNSLGRIETHSVWVEDPIKVFSNPGEYRINYKRKDDPFGDADLDNVFNNYRYWSTDYDPIIATIS